MSTNVNDPVTLRDEIENLRALLHEQKTIATANSENLNKKLNDVIERDNARFTQLNTVVDLLIKENQEMKGLISNQRFVIQPVNPYNYGGSNNGSQAIINGNGSQQSVNPFQDTSFIAPQAPPSSSQNGTSSSTGHVHSGSNPDQQSHHHSQQQQAQHHHQQQQAQAQAQHQHQHQRQQQQQQQQQQQLQHQQQQHQHQQTQQHSPNQHATPHQGAISQQGPNGHHTPVLEGSLTDQNANGSMIRFINNQYVDDSEAQINATNNAQGPNGSRIDFVFMDPSSNRRGAQYRVHSNSMTPNAGNAGVVRDDDTSLGSANTDASITIPTSNSRLQKSATRTAANEFDPENYDLIIHNDFNRVEDVYYEYYNSLKPQVEKVSKAYKVKKIRKYQKIKALAVRIDRYRKYKGCSLEESFDYFEDLRLGSDNRKKSVAWLYNSLPDVLKKVGLEDQLKKSSGSS